MGSVLARLEGVAYAALRIVAGFLFWVHGLQKLFGLFGGREVELASRLGAAGLIETIAGTLIMIGLWTVPAAFIASGEMAFAYFLAHLPRGPWPVQNAGEPAVLLCFIFLFIATRGAGRISVDALLGRNWFRR
jgi:putative oxidoreductase